MSDTPRAPWVIVPVYPDDVDRAVTDVVAVELRLQSPVAAPSKNTRSEAPGVTPADAPPDDFDQQVGLVKEPGLVHPVRPPRQ